MAPAQWALRAPAGPYIVDHVACRSGIVGTITTTLCRGFHNICGRLKINREVLLHNRTVRL
jgi:hypothetical protein